MSSRPKVPGDGKLREETAVTGAEVEECVDALVAAHDGPVDAFRSALEGVRASLRRYGWLMGDKARRNQRIVTSQAEVDRFDRIASKIAALLPSPHPELNAEMDLFDGFVASALRGCRRNMEQANRTQTAKGQRSDSA